MRGLHVGDPPACYHLKGNPAIRLDHLTRGFAPPPHGGFAFGLEEVPLFRSSDDQLACQAIRPFVTRGLERFCEPRTWTKVPEHGRQRLHGMSSGVTNCSSRSP